MKNVKAAVLAILLCSCSGREMKPVDLYEEDACAFCRMAISNSRFAGEIITEETEVFKFDDIGCLRRFREERLRGGTAVSFVRDYESGAWLAEHDAVIAQTGVMTPMGSGLAAFRDSLSALEFSRQFPAGE